MLKTVTAEDPKNRRFFLHLNLYLTHGLRIAFEQIKLRIFSLIFLRKKIEFIRLFYNADWQRFKTTFILFLNGKNSPCFPVSVNCEPYHAKIYALNFKINFALISYFYACKKYSRDQVIFKIPFWFLRSINNFHV